MFHKHAPSALALVLVLAGASQARCQAPPETAAQTPPAAPPSDAPAGAAASSVTPPAPAFKPGAPVLDRAGQRVGAVQTLTESAEGPMVVVQIEGKLVSLPQATLRFDEGNIVSSQTRAEMLAAAGAPR